MRRFLLALFFVNISLIAFCQDFTKVDIIKHEGAANAEWQITDLNKITRFAEQDYPESDTVTVIINKNEAYYLAISISEVLKDGSALYTVLFNGEEEFTINSSMGCGDHFVPFNTGMKGGETKIIGGSDADIADFPWQIFLYISDGDYYYSCGGSIIADKWILTAAHCTLDDVGNDFSSDSMFVFIGASDISETETIHSVKRFIRHAAYNSSTYANDIALLELKTPMTLSANVQPIKMVTALDAAEGMTAPGVMATVSGWGEINAATHESSMQLQAVNLPIVSRETAQTVWPGTPNNVIMAGYHNGTKDACRGDSGGPLVVPAGDEGKKLAGVVSWGNEDCNTYGAYTEVSAFRNWITENTGIHEVLPSEPTGDTIICQGVTSSTFTTATLEDAVSYQWELSPENAGSIIGHDTSATVTWRNGFTGDVRIKVRATINDINIPTAWSHHAATVAKNTTISKQSSDMALCARGSFTLSMDVTGHDVTYSWYKDGNVLSGRTTNTLERLNVSELESGQYYCIATGACGTSTSDIMKVEVRPITKIVSSTPDTTVTFGAATHLRVNAAGHNLQYQWKKNGINIAGATSSSLIFNDMTANDIGQYNVSVKGTCGTESTLQRYLYVNRDVNPENPDIYVWPTITSGIINIAPSGNENYNIRIFNSIGKLVFENSDYRYQSEIDLSHLPRGMYIVQITAGSIKKTTKIIKSE